VNLRYMFKMLLVLMRSSIVKIYEQLPLKKKAFDKKRTNIN